MGKLFYFFMLIIVTSGCGDGYDTGSYNTSISRNFVSSAKTDSVMDSIMLADSTISGGYFFSTVAGEMAHVSKSGKTAILIEKGKIIFYFEPKEVSRLNDTTFTISNKHDAMMIFTANVKSPVIVDNTGDKMVKSAEIVRDSLLLTGVHYKDFSLFNMRSLVKIPFRFLAESRSSAKDAIYYLNDNIVLLTEYDVGSYPFLNRYEGVKHDKISFVNLASWKRSVRFNEAKKITNNFYLLSFTRYSSILKKKVPVKGKKILRLSDFAISEKLFCETARNGKGDNIILYSNGAIAPFSKKTMRQGPWHMVR